MGLVGVVLIASVLIPLAGAQEADPIALSCVGDKLKAAGKQCACLHKEWRSAAMHATVPDFAKCDAKFEAGITKAIAKAQAKGGACPTDADALSLGPVIAGAADTVVKLVALKPPVGVACDDVNQTVK